MTHREGAWRRWTSAEDFYQERDHRTVLGVREFAAYTQRTIELWVDPETAHYRTVQILALVAANLTARWARNVRVIIPETSLDPALQRGQYHALGDRLSLSGLSHTDLGSLHVTLSVRHLGPDGHRHRGSVWRCRSCTSIVRVIQ